MDKFLIGTRSRQQRLEDLYDRFGGDVARFVFPPWVCGDFTIISQYGDKYKVQFRRAPRKNGYQGRFVLWWDDSDQGKVLLGVLDPKTSEVIRVSNIVEHDPVWNAWQTWVATEANGTRDNYACAWCGRELEQESDVIHTFVHPNCRKKIGEA